MMLQTYQVDDEDGASDWLIANWGTASNGHDYLQKTLHKCIQAEDF